MQVIWAVIPPSMEYARKLALGIISALRDTEYELRAAESLVHIRDQYAREEEVGFLVFGIWDPDVKALREQGKPAVNMSGRTAPEELLVPSVLPDNVRAGELAAEYLIGMGHRGVAIWDREATALN